MRRFEICSEFSPTGDQPAAIDALADGLAQGLADQVLLGVTGSGKTFSIASLIERVQRPALVLAHNKTLAAQLYQEFKRLSNNLNLMLLLFSLNLTFTTKTTSITS